MSRRRLPRRLLGGIALILVGGALYAVGAPHLGLPLVGRGVELVSQPAPSQSAPEAEPPPAAAPVVAPAPSPAGEPAPGSYSPPAPPVQPVSAAPAVGAEP